MKIAFILLLTYFVLAQGYTVGRSYFFGGDFDDGFFGGDFDDDFFGFGYDDDFDDGFGFYFGDGGGAFAHHMSKKLYFGYGDD